MPSERFLERVVGHEADEPILSDDGPVGA
jgi:hypothetical protein